MGKKQHSKDRMFVTATEWKEQFGGHKQNTNSASGALPYNCCALSLREFETPYWLIQFLGSLFDLKPNLITNESYQKFRIVIELYTGGTETRFDLYVVEEVIEHLKEKACKVPVLVYSDHELGKKLYQSVEGA